MQREADILQQRVQTATVQGRRQKALKGVGSEKRKGQKRDGDQSLHAKGRDLQIFASFGLGGRKEPAEERQDQHPQQD